MNPEPLYLVGPTASGKSALAMELARRLDGEIVNADAFQLYRGLDICTAKPLAADFAHVPHHLFGVIDPGESTDAQSYSEIARPIIASITARGRTPIVTGGSGLYVKSLTHGLSELPSSEQLREKLSQLTSTERIEQLLDLDSNARITVNLKNDRHVSRALEICVLTGQPQSELRKAWSQNPPKYHGLRFLWSRPALNARINQRVLDMIHTGLIAEIAALPQLSSTSEKAIGVREVRAHLSGELNLEQTTDAIQLATRQYARRQEKWFKREQGFKVLTICASDSLASIADRAISLLAAP